MCCEDMRAEHRLRLWLIMLLWLLFWAFGNFTPQGQPYWNRGGWLVGFLLFFLLGWRPVWLHHASG